MIRARRVRKDRPSENRSRGRNSCAPPREPLQRFHVPGSFAARSAARGSRGGTREDPEYRYRARGAEKSFATPPARLGGIDREQIQA